MTAVLIHSSTPVLLICEEQEREEVMQLAQALIVGDAEPEIVFVGPSNMIAADIAVASLSRKGLIIPCLPVDLETRLRARMKDAVREGHGYLESSWDRDAPRRNLPAIRRHLAALVDHDVDAPVPSTAAASATPARAVETNGRVEGPRLVAPAVSPAQEIEPEVNVGSLDATVAERSAEMAAVARSSQTHGSPGTSDSSARERVDVIEGVASAERRGGRPWLTFVFGALAGGAVVWIGGLEAAPQQPPEEVASPVAMAPSPDGPTESGSAAAPLDSNSTSPVRRIVPPRPVAASATTTDAVDGDPAAAGSEDGDKAGAASAPAVAATDTLRDGTEPREPTEVTEPSEPTEPTEPTEPAEPTVPAELLEATEATEPTAETLEAAAALSRATESDAQPSGSSPVKPEHGTVPVSATVAGLDIHVPAERTWDDTWNRAMRHCKRLEPEKFGLWRVPTRSEFNRIKTSTVLIPQDMWTASKVSADVKSAYVFRYRREFFDKLKKTSRARFVCVRDHDGPPENRESR